MLITVTGQERIGNNPYTVTHLYDMGVHYPAEMRVNECVVKLGRAESRLYDDMARDIVGDKKLIRDLVKDYNTTMNQALNLMLNAIKGVYES